MGIKKCCIFGAGTYYGTEKPVEGSYVIAADGGYNYLKSLGAAPDIIIGDFDSGECPEEGNIIRLNPVKDETDTYNAIMTALEKGCDEFHIFGGTGGRTAHTISNIQSLVMLAERGIKAYLYGDREILTVIHNDSVRFSSDSKGYISVFAIGEKSSGVTESGLKYCIENRTMSNSYPCGVSNEFIGEEAVVSVSDGSLLIIFTSAANEIS